MSIAEHARLLKSSIVPVEMTSDQALNASFRRRLRQLKRGILGSNGQRIRVQARPTTVTLCAHVHAWMLSPILLSLRQKVLLFPTINAWRWSCSRVLQPQGDTRQ